MTDTTVDQTATAPVPAAGDDDKRKAVAKHELIATPGGDHVSIGEALGIRYTDRASGNNFEYMIPGAQAGTALTMLAIFGAKTKATNEASRVRNGKDGDVDAEFEALDEAFENITNGIWREKAEGGAGTRTDWSLVASVLHAMLGDKAAGDVAHYQTRLGAGVPKEELTDDQTAFRKKVWSNDQIKGEYKKQKGSTGPALDTLA